MIDIVLQILLFQYRTILQILLFMCLQTLLFIETVFIIISLNIRILICLFISLEHDVCFYVILLLSVTDSSNMFSEHNIRHSGLNIFHLYNLKVIILPIWRYQGFKRESFWYVSGNNCFFLKKNCVLFIFNKKTRDFIHMFLDIEHDVCIILRVCSSFIPFYFFTIVLFPFRNIWYNKGYFLTLISRNQTSKSGHISMDFHLAGESHTSWFSWYDDMHLLVSLLLIVSCPTSHQRKKKYYLDSYFTCQKIV